MIQVRHEPCCLVRSKSLIINLPGKPSAINDCLHVVFPAVSNHTGPIEGACLTVDETQCKVFRPAHAVRKAA